MKEATEQITDFLSLENIYHGIGPELARKLATDLVAKIVNGEITNIAARSKQPVMTEQQKAATLEALTNSRKDGFFYSDIYIDATNAIESGKIPHLGVIE